MAIYNSLYNNMKHDDQISNLILGLLLELKEVVHSKKKILIIANLSTRIEKFLCFKNSIFKMSSAII